MDKTREYREYLEQQQKPTSGVAREIQRLKTDGGTTAVELREFLSHLKGRSPREVMGVVAESNLVRSILTATAGCFVFLVVFTIIPYAIKGRTGSVSAKPAAAAVTESTTVEPPAATTTTVPASGQAAAPPAAPDLERAAKAMGIGGTAEADPKTNPLDKKLDKLLDGIE